MLKKVYLKLLDSQRWKSLKRIYLKDGFCWVCGSKENLNLHHFSYKRKLFFNPINLILLCRNCHKNLHFSTGKKEVHKNFNALKRFKEELKIKEKFGLK